MKVVIVTAALLFAAATAAAQDRQEGDLPDPNCEEDPFQAGCQESCAGPEDCSYPPCPTGLAGQALEDGSIFLSWTLNSFSDILVYRSEAGGPMEQVAHLEFPTTKWIDHDTQAGVTYEYRVVAFGQHQYDESVEPEGESQGCKTLTLTAIPFFPSVWAIGAAVAGGTIGLAAMSRRRRL